MTLMKYFCLRNAPLIDDVDISQQPRTRNGTKVGLGLLFFEVFFIIIFDCEYLGQKQHRIV